VTKSLTTGLKKASSIARRALTPGKPHHAQWLITRKCNYKCAGCNVWKEQDEKELSTDEIKKGLDILEKMGIIELVISGGNPLLRKDIGEIIEYASERFVTTVYDNGSMAAKKVDVLKKADFAAISIDSLDEKKNDSIKDVQGAWKNAMNAVDILQKDWITKKGYRVVACYTPFCIHYRPNVVWTLRGSLNLIAEALSIGSVRLISKLFLAYGFYTVYSIYRLLNFR